MTPTSKDVRNTTDSQKAELIEDIEDTISDTSLRKHLINRILYPPKKVYPKPPIREAVPVDPYDRFTPEQEMFLKRKVVVMVDAHNDYLQLYKDILGPSIHIFTNIQNATEFLKTTKPDLLTTSLYLPKPEAAFEFIKFVRSKRSLSQVPIMIITAFTAALNDEQLKSLEITKQITKPFALGSFRKVIIEILGLNVA
jgi:CheY-like chemotaxis protein